MSSTANATYALDAESEAFFGAPAFSLVHRNDDTVVGRFGRSGRIKGTMIDRLLIASWNDTARRGWLTLAFSRYFRSFRGNCGQYEERHSVRGRKSASGSMPPRSRKATDPAQAPIRGRRVSLEEVLEYYQR